MFITIRRCEHVDATESNHTHAQYAARARSSRLTNIIYVCASKRTDIFGLLHRVQLFFASPIQI